MQKDSFASTKFKKNPFYQKDFIIHVPNNLKKSTIKPQALSLEQSLLRHIINGNIKEIQKQKLKKDFPLECIETKIFEVLKNLSVEQIHEYYKESNLCKKYLFLNRRWSSPSSDSDREQVKGVKCQFELDSKHLQVF